MRNNYLKLTIFVSLFIPFSVSAATPSVKINDARYAAKFVTQFPADPVTIPAGGTKTVVVTFKNTGTATWDSAGKNFISAYTMEPRNRSSVFATKTWRSTKETGKLLGKIKPGKTGNLVIDLKAPTKTGDYTEKFYLSAENHTWVKGGYFFVSIRVVPPESESESRITTSTTSDKTASDVNYQAHRMFVNPRQVTAKGGDIVSLVVGWQNIGTSPWKSYTLAATSPTALATGQQLSFADVSWKNHSIVLSRDSAIESNSFVRETFYFRAPRTAGTYTASFKLQADGHTFDNAAVTIPVIVTDDAPPNYAEPVFQEDLIPSSTPEVPLIAEEPRIRVGLWKPEGSVQVLSADDDYTVLDGTTAVGVLLKDHVGLLSYQAGVYTFKAGDVVLTSTSYLRLQPATNPHAVFQLLNYDRTVSWKGNRNFNLYHGAIEYRLADNPVVVYVINDLLFEDYMNGIGENANTAPAEYLKAQAIAQRSYAYYTQVYTTKHDKRNFDVVANTGDQLYLGYASEQIMPRFVAAVADTRGLMVTYNNQVVITPYFGNTDGRTRSWVEVWGGASKPWLVSVPATYDARDHKKMFGHGVGMSQRDAAYRADEEGLDYLALIKYYYTGTEVRRVYP